MIRRLAAATFAVVALVGCSPSYDAPAPGPMTEAATSTGGAQGQSVTIERWVDGDTVDTTAGRVRILGIDTPEYDECGFDEASAEAEAIAPVGSAAVLVKAPDDDDTDRYGRLLRYVVVDGTDVGLTLIERGLAIARYDSRDGYGPHPYEAAYIAADEAAPNLC